jgi:hypothetical protein
MHGSSYTFTPQTEDVNGSSDDFDLSRTPLFDAARFRGCLNHWQKSALRVPLGIFACQFLDERNALASLSVKYSIAALAWARWQIHVGLVRPQPRRRSISQGSCSNGGHRIHGSCRCCSKTVWLFSKRSGSCSVNWSLSFTSERI